MGTAASQIHLFAAWTCVAILAVEGTRVARSSRHHRFSSSPEIPPSDHPSHTGTPSFRQTFTSYHLWNSRNWSESIAVARSHPPTAIPKRKHRMHHHPFRRSTSLSGLNPATQGCRGPHPRRLEPMTVELTKLPRHEDKRPVATDL
ncbi:hypothetical protein HID58_011732 [Brassica napus]|uniref:Secreted protein n=1 Tax=Brassica napus TaxID=3708 RepID=A0ABQ8E1P5_BRANA|nr:hypothetical protein HID58_011732 [Brassica napus]